MSIPVWFIGGGVLAGQEGGFRLHFRDGYSIFVPASDALALIESASTPNFWRSL